MAITISVFNNKGGVGKTTYLYHVSHLIEKMGKRVLMVDCDSQCNLTAYCMRDAAINKSWSKDGNSIWRQIEPIYQGLGDFRRRQPTAFDKNYPNLYLIPGDLLLSDFEDHLGDTWNPAKGGSEPALRAQTAIFRFISWASDHVNADVVMIDLGPNLGSLNRAVLGASDYFIVPMAPDLFSIRGTENLGSKLVLWNKEWQQCNDAYKAENIQLPPAKPIFLGYVLQHHNIRDNPRGMTKGWQQYGDKVEEAVQKNIVEKLADVGQTQHSSTQCYMLGRIPNLHSLIPYSMTARKPVFDCKSADGLKGNCSPLINRRVEDQQACWAVAGLRAVLMASRADRPRRRPGAMTEPAAA